MSQLKTAEMFLRYKAWANEITFSSLAVLPETELYKERDSYFGNIISTLNHVYVIDDVFKAHLNKAKHTYTKRNTDDCPSLKELSCKQKVMDQWYIDYILGVDEKNLQNLVRFEYIGGEQGMMSVNEVILHLVNHASNHRGHVSEMMYKTEYKLKTHDLTAYLKYVQKNV